MNWDEVLSLNDIFERKRISLEKSYAYLIEHDNTQKSFEELLNSLRTPEAEVTLRSLIDELERSKLYIKGVHGSLHAIKVVIYAYCIATDVGVERDDLIDLIIASAYHDIGRKSDGEDCKHGRDGAVLLSDMPDIVGRGRRDIICFLVEAHSYPDDDRISICYKWNIDPKSNAMLLSDILKDADALDRFRLGDHALDPVYLRTDQAHNLIKAAYMLNRCVSDKVIKRVSSGKGLKSNHSIRLYRYFYYPQDVFASITDLGIGKGTGVDDTVEKGTFNIPKQKNTRDYLERRVSTERSMRDDFIKRGGHPRREHPYYFTLGRCDEIFMNESGYVGYISYDIDEFMTECVSFTYGDSIPVFDPEYNYENIYRNRVLTLEEIRVLISDRGTDIENVHSDYGVEYIEAQVWCDDPVCNVRLDPALGEDELKRRIHVLSKKLNYELTGKENDLGYDYYMNKIMDIADWDHFHVILKETIRSGKDEKSGFRIGLLTFILDFLSGGNESEKNSRDAIVLDELRFGMKRFDAALLETKNGKELVLFSIELIYHMLFFDVKKEVMEMVARHTNLE